MHQLPQDVDHGKLPDPKRDHERDSDQRARKLRLNCRPEVNMQHQAIDSVPDETGDHPVGSAPAGPGTPQAHSECRCDLGLDIEGFVLNRGYLPRGRSTAWGSAHTVGVYPL